MATKKRQVLQYQRIVGLFLLFQSCLKDKKGARKDTVEYPNRTPFPKKRLGGTIVGNHYPGRRFQSLY